MDGSRIKVKAARNRKTSNRLNKSADNIDFDISEKELLATSQEVNEKFSNRKRKDGPEQSSSTTLKVRKKTMEVEKEKGDAESVTVGDLRSMVSQIIDSNTKQTETLGNNLKEELKSTNATLTALSGTVSGLKTDGRQIQNRNQDSLTIFLLE